MARGCGRPAARARRFSIAEIVADALDHDGRGVGQCARRGDLIAQVLEKMLRCARVHIVVAGQAGGRGGGRHARQVSHQPADRQAQLQGTARPVALPEGHLARLARCRGDEYAIVSDLVDAPGRGAEDKDFADAALEDHLFIELANPRGRVALRGRPRTGRDRGSFRHWRWPPASPSRGHGSRARSRDARPKPANSSEG
jgi:hypothetical protein